MRRKKNTKLILILTTLCTVGFLLSGFPLAEPKQQKLELFSDLAARKTCVHTLGIEEGWPQVYDGGDDDSAQGVAIDSNGNVTVTGYSFNTSIERYNALTIQYDKDGHKLGKIPFNNNGYSCAVAITADSHNNFIILGWNGTTLDDLQNFTGEIFIVKYDNNGVELWNLSFLKDKYICPGGITVDSHDNIIITGWTGDGLTKTCWTIKMDSTGQELWNATYHEDMDDCGLNPVVDSHDNIVIAGFWSIPGGGGNYIIKYDSNGSMLLTKRFIAETNEFLIPNAVAVDLKDYIIIVGEKYSYTTYTNVMCTQKYDSTGGLLWTREYNSGFYDNARAVAVDSHNNIIVGGWSSFSKLNNIEQCTVFYNENGDELCVKRPSVQGQILDVAVYNDSIFITGEILNGNSSDYYTDKYLDVNPPSVTLDKPKDGHLYIFDGLALPRVLPTTTNAIVIGKITIKVTSANLSDVEKVEFYIDNTLKETVNTTPFQWVWNEFAFGKQHQIRIMAYDHSGCIKRTELTVRKFF